MNFATLVSFVRARAPYSTSALHGERHWRCVAWTALDLAGLTPGADPLVAMIFSILHDSMRENEGRDPGHGRRAAEYAGRLNGTLIKLADSQLEMLVNACSNHCGGPPTDETTVGVCLDADRLNLWRIGITPDAHFLSTVAARDARYIYRARCLHNQAPSWPEVFERYPQVCSPRISTDPAALPAR